VEPTKEKSFISQFLGITAMALDCKDLEPVIKGKTHPFVAIPADWKIEDLQKFLPAPRHIQQSFNTEDVVSFIEYVKQWKQPSTRIFYDAQALQFEAILDYHLPAAGDAEAVPSWKSHVAALTLEQSDEWKVWAGSSGKRMTQVDFAQFVETNYGDVSTPTSADMLELALTLDVKKNVSWNSAIRLGNGQAQLGYTEEITGHGGGKRVQEIPEKISLSIPVLLYGAKRFVDARFRYRLQEQKLVLWYEIEKPAQILRDAGAAALNRVITETGVDVFIGTA
jgi:uncharacterized protein YfdQ (DUF2303 family)